ncbi:hypothetical protein ABTD78_22625, partial [Acinetobacter baumannii]
MDDPLIHVRVDASGKKVEASALPLARDDLQLLQRHFAGVCAAPGRAYIGAAGGAARLLQRSLLVVSG